MVDNADPNKMMTIECIKLNVLNVRGFEVWR